MRRRDVITLIGSGVLGMADAASVQRIEHIHRVGILMPLPESDPESQHRLAAFSHTLRQIGWVEGQTIALGTRFCDGNPAHLPPLATELVRANVDAVVTQAEPVDALRHATTSTPIVMASVGDAVGTLIATDQGQKRLQLIKELSPTIVLVALLSNANASGHRLQLKEMEPAAAKLGLALQSLALKTADEIDSALHAALQANAQAIITMDDPLIQSQRRKIIVWAATAVANNGRISADD
jgi:putative ABC transport system substrate-binding protein